MQGLCRKTLLLALSLGLCAIANAQTAAKPAPKPLPSKKYCHGEGSFCFKYPESWTLLGEVFGGNGVVVAPPQKQERENWDEVTSALVFPAPQSAADAISIDQAIEQAVSRVREGGQNFETLERQRRRVDNKPAQLVKLHYVDKPSGREWIEELVFVEGPDEEIYSVALKCAPSSLARMQPVFSRILDSWTLPEAEAPTGANGSDAQSATEPATPPSKAPRPRQLLNSNERGITLQQIETIIGIKAACRGALQAGKRLGLVPTMGALHAGHLSLVRESKSQCDVTAVSIFVNPLQFGPTEDFAKYPRTLEHDAALLQELGVDILFVPSVVEMYPPGAKTNVEVIDLSGRLDGASRPGHFRGVTTVVCKLFEIVRPDRAFFGQKDAAQAAVLRKMVRDLDMDVEIVVCPIVRETDGLAMSSRNAYLNAEQRQQALVLSRSLQQVKSAVDGGEREAGKLAEIGTRIIAAEPGAKLDYFAIVDADTLEPVASVSRGTLVAVAAWVGTTRLIDNILL